MNETGQNEQNAAQPEPTLDSIRMVMVNPSLLCPTTLQQIKEETDVLSFLCFEPERMIRTVSIDTEIDD